MPILLDCRAIYARVEMRQPRVNLTPITYLRTGAPPFLIAHGDRDPLVPHHQSELLADALRKVNVPVIFHTVKGGAHGFRDPDADRLLKDFFAKHLKSESSTEK